MKFAIPLADGKLAMHFGHCEEFALVEVDDETEDIVETERVTPPAHAPGVLPKFLADQGASVIIAGGMGTRAQDMFAHNDIKVVVGAPAESPEKLVQDLLDEDLDLGDNVCDH
ncbi:MAG: NifB/NifX family molybdenum-iron cluster-binding protein [Planctomycetes bacterium]|nr:NifB/NifX family molybdenum-iron cluster-binding protein [Planctomycetota bacterium]